MTAREFGVIDVVIRNQGTSISVNGGIYSDAGGNPGALLAEFSPRSIPTGMPATRIRLATGVPFVLQPGTTYWFVIRGSSTPGNLVWDALVSNDPPRADPDVMFVDYRFSTNGGATWTSSGICNPVAISEVLLPQERFLAGFESLP